MITTITGKNQITLPAEIVKALELTSGTQLEWTIGPNRTLIARPLPPRSERVDALMGAGRKYLRSRLRSGARSDRRSVAG